MSAGVSHRYPVDYLEVAKKFGAQFTLRKPLKSKELESAVRDGLHLPRTKSEYARSLTG